MLAVTDSCFLIHLVFWVLQVQLNMCIYEPDSMTAAEKLRLSKFQNALLSIGGLFLDDKTATLT